MRRWFLIIALSSLAMLFEASPCPALSEGDSVPEVILKATDGKSVSLRAMKGNALVVIFWATWCPTCKEQIGHLSELQKDYPRRSLQIVGISSEDEDTVKGYLKTRPLPFPTLIDYGFRVHKTFGAFAVPVTFVIDRSCIVRKKFFGPADPADLKKAIEAVI
jgi:peroxiredoxin